MNEKIVRNLINTRWQNGRGVDYAWAELILLYEDGTWEKIFEYREPDMCRVRSFHSGGAVPGKTRAEVIEMVKKQYNSGKIEGVFTV